jgi:hypothetical protein
MKIAIRYIPALSGVILVITTLVYCSWVIVSQERRWDEFVRYVKDRDSKRLEVITKNEARLDEILAALARLEARP